MSSCSLILYFIFFDVSKKNHDSTWCTTWERDHKLIAWNYLSTWFLIDLISFIPYDIFLLNSTTSARSDLGLLRWLRLFRLLRLVKLVKVIAHGRIIEKIVVPRAPAFISNDLVVSISDTVRYTFYGLYVDDDS